MYISKHHSNIILSHIPSASDHSIYWQFKGKYVCIHADLVWLYISFSS